MKTVKLDGISVIKTEKVRTDGKIRRKYFTAYFSNPANPFTKSQQRNVFQDHNNDGTIATWKHGSPELVSSFIGKEILGEFINCEVKPYEIDGRMITNYSTVVLEGEKLTTILKQNGHELSTGAVTALAKDESLSIKESINALNK